MKLEMATAGSTSYYFSTAFLFVLAFNLLSFQAKTASGQFINDIDRVQFALNLEFLEAEFFLYSSLGTGLDTISPSLTQGGPAPIGAQKANLDPLVGPIIEEFGYQEVGHIRAIVTRVGGFPRPLINLSRKNFAKLFDQAVGFNLVPPFDPYANSVNFLLAAYLIPYVGIGGYVGVIPNLTAPATLELVASLLGVEAGQDAVIRALLYEKKNLVVLPYNFTVAEFTNRISALRNPLGGNGNKDEGLIVPITLGAENRTSSNVLSADPNSLSYARTPAEILGIVYGTGNATMPGGFFPLGANGKIATTLRI